MLSVRNSASFRPETPYYARSARGRRAARDAERSRYEIHTHRESELRTLGIMDARHRPVAASIRDSAFSKRGMGNCERSTTGVASRAFVIRHFLHAKWAIANARHLTCAGDAGTMLHPRQHGMLDK